MMRKKLLIVGLGNPGKKYEKTRHNVGFRVIDALEKKISDKDIVLFKPQTFMNNSGKAIAELISNFQFPISNLWIIHDDIDLSLGVIRVSKNISSAGHRGVQSIIDELGTQDFTRIRIGIKHETCNIKPETSDYVLQKFSKDEEKTLKKIIKEAAEIIQENIKK